MTEPIEPPPTSPAPLPLSVVLLGHSGATELEDSLRAWIEFLRGINRSFEVILSADAGLAFRENEPERNRLPDGRVVIPPDQYEILGRIMELKQFPEVKTVVPPPGQVWGLGAALRTGLAEAKHPLIFFTLADKQYQPGDLPSFLEEINQVHLVSGFRLGGRIPWWLNLGGFFYRLFCQVVFGLPVEGSPLLAGLGRAATATSCTLVIWNPFSRSGVCVLPVSPGSAGPNSHSVARIVCTLGIPGQGELHRAQRCGAFREVHADADAAEGGGRFVFSRGMAGLPSS